MRDEASSDMRTLPSNLVVLTRLVVAMTMRPSVLGLSPKSQGGRQVDIDRPGGVHRRHEYSGLEVRETRECSMRCMIGIRLGLSSSCNGERHYRILR